MHEPEYETSGADARDLLKDPKLLCIKPDEMQTCFLEGLDSAEPILLENGKTSDPESVGVSLVRFQIAESKRLCVAKARLSQLRMLGS